MFAAGIILVRRQGSEVFLLASVVVGVIGGLYLLLLFRQSDIGYKPFKLLTFFSPILWCCLLLILRRQHARGLLATVQVLLALALVTGNGIRGVQFIRWVDSHHQYISAELADLTRLEADPRIASINIETSNFWTNMWETIFLFHKPLHHKISTYYNKSSLSGEWTVLERNGGDRILRVQRCEAETIVVNDRFAAVRGAELFADWGLGWQGDEQTHRWTAEQTSSIRLIASRAEAVRAQLAYYPLKSSNRLSVRVNGRFVMDCPPQTCSFEMKLDPGETSLELVGSGLPEVPPMNDDRRLGFSLSEIRLAQTDCAPGSSAPGH